jgi:predicted dehydrogenase
MDNYAVVGMGSIAQRHLKNLRLLYPESRISVVSASGINANLPYAADEIISIEQLIFQSPKFVIIASPAPFHVKTAKFLLTHNIPVLIEKPLAESFSTCNDFLNFCDGDFSDKSAVGYCLRFLPSACIVKKLIAQEAIGTIYNVSSIVGQYLPDWRTDKNYKDSVSARKELGGGALLELSHELDYLTWFFDDLELKHSWLRTSDELDLNVEDIANLVMTSNSGIYITVHLDFVQKSTQRKCEIIGEKGRIVWDLVANSVTLYAADGIHHLYDEPAYDKNNMYLEMLKAFADMPSYGQQELASIESSSRVLQLIELAKVTNQWR